MASSSYTSSLGLCAWASADKPKRADFVADNAIIDNILGGHVNNTSVHMSSAEKAKALTPYTMVTYAGTGAASRTVSTDYRPSAVIVYKKNVPFTVQSDGATVVNAAVSCYGLGASSGVAIVSAGFTVYQDSTASAGVLRNLNEEDGQYVALLFK